MSFALYQKFRDLWKDKPDKTTPVTAEALNHFEQGIYDNSNNIIELGRMISNSGTENITDRCSISASEQTIEITAPINVILDNMLIDGNMECGDYVGVISVTNLPPMVLVAHVSGLKSSGEDVTSVDGKAVLINPYPSTVEQYGLKYEGDIEFDASNDAKVRFTFDIGRSISISSSASVIYRTAGSAVDFSISQISGDLSNKINDLGEHLGKQIEELESAVDNIEYSPIKTVDVTYSNITVNTKSVQGLYYKDIVATFVSMGIPQNATVIGLTLTNYEGATSMFGLYMSSNKLSVDIMSDDIQTIQSLSFRVSYYVQTAENNNPIKTISYSGYGRITNPTEDGLYYGTLATLDSIGVPTNATIISLMLGTWSGASAVYNAYVDEREGAIKVFSNVSQNPYITIFISYVLND